MALDSTIDKEDICKGDKLRVSWTESDVDYIMTGVAHEKDGVGDWKTARGVWLVITPYRRNQVIELLERAKTAEEILEERRDAHAVEFTAGWATTYNVLGDSLQRAIDHIIELEDEKEALVN